MISLLPNWLHRLIFSEDNYTEGANTLVNLFQHPILNKQVNNLQIDKIEFISIGKIYGGLQA